MKYLFFGFIFILSSCSHFRADQSLIQGKRVPAEATSYSSCFEVLQSVLNQQPDNFLYGFFKKILGLNPESELSPDQTKILKDIISQEDRPGAIKLFEQKALERKLEFTPLEHDRFKIDIPRDDKGAHSLNRFRLLLAKLDGIQINLVFDPAQELNPKTSGGGFAREAKPYQYTLFVSLRSVMLDEVTETEIQNLAKIIQDSHLYRPGVLTKIVPQKGNINSLSESYDLADFFAHIEVLKFKLLKMQKRTPSRKTVDDTILYIDNKIQSMEYVLRLTRDLVKKLGHNSDTSDISFSYELVTEQKIKKLKITALDLSRSPEQSYSVYLSVPSEIEKAQTSQMIFIKELNQNTIAFEKLSKTFLSVSLELKKNPKPSPLDISQLIELLENRK